MKDLKIYYDAKGKINSEFDKEIEKLAKKHGLNFMGSGMTIDTGIRDLHYREEKKKLSEQ